MNSSQTPESPRTLIGWWRPSQWLKVPTTLTRSAFGAQTAKRMPRTPSTVQLVRAEEAVRVHVAAVREAREVERVDVRLEANTDRSARATASSNPCQRTRYGSRDRAARARPTRTARVPGTRSSSASGCTSHARFAFGRCTRTIASVGDERMEAEHAARVVQPAAQESFDVGIAQVRAQHRRAARASPSSFRSSIRGR